MLTAHDVSEMMVSDEVDVLVAGGGPAGISAGFAAARLGARTLIVEQFNCLGGVAGAGGHGHFCQYASWGTHERIVGGVMWEVVERLVDAGFGVHDNAWVDFEVEGLKLILEQIAEECGCRLLYHTFLCDTIVEGGRAVGAVIQNKTGRTVVRAKHIIDCTGDGDAAAMAGCKYEQGNPEGICQPVTLMFTIGGVDHSKVDQFRRKIYPAEYGDPEWWTLTKVWEKAQAAGDMRPFQNRVMGFWWTPTRPDQIGVNFTHINFVDTTRAEDLTAATIEGRKQAHESIEVFRKYVPGMEDCYMVSTPNTIGLRESRRIRGEYVMTRDDIVSQRCFEDSIGYGSFFIDIHSTSGPGMDQRTWRPPTGFRYQIPYRIVVPTGIDNLLVAGRCASCDHEALGSLRQMAQCGVMGQATGTAAALSLHSDAAPRNVDITALQQSLQSQGCIIDTEDVAAVN
jgi:hypothetical protein